VDEAMVAGAVVANLRELLLELGDWRDLRRAADTLAERRLVELDDAHGTQWVPFASYAALMHAVGATHEDDRVQELGYAWLDRALARGFLANMIRSWLRSFAHTPKNITLLVPHLWPVVYRNAGRMRMIGRGEGFLTMRVEPTPEALIQCPTWHRMLEGVGAALFEVSEVASSVQVGPASGREDALDFLVLAG